MTSIILKSGELHVSVCEGNKLRQFMLKDLQTIPDLFGTIHVHLCINSFETRRALQWFLFHLTTKYRIVVHMDKCVKMDTYVYQKFVRDVADILYLYIHKVEAVRIDCVTDDLSVFYPLLRICPYLLECDVCIRLRTASSTSSTSTHLLGKWEKDALKMSYKSIPYGSIEYLQVQTDSASGTDFVLFMDKFSNMKIHVKYLHYDAKQGSIVKKQVMNPNTIKHKWSMWEYWFKNLNMKSLQIDIPDTMKDVSDWKPLGKIVESNQNNSCIFYISRKLYTWKLFLIQCFVLFILFGMYMSLLVIMYSYL